MSTLRIPEAAIPAWDRLTLALLTVEPGCAADPERWWSYDAGDIEAAAHGCRQCRVLHLCRDYADAAKEPAGTWGGVNREPSTTKETTT